MKMASVRLDFTPPMLPDVTELHIEEAPTQDGTFAEIEVVTAVGTYPNYISNYTTTFATDNNYWFRIRWETSQGVSTPYSLALQGGTKTLVQEIVDRTLLRNPTLNEIIVTQEAQAVISESFPGQDPNTIPVEDDVRADPRDDEHDTRPLVDRNDARVRWLCVEIHSGPRLAPG